MEGAEGPIDWGPGSEGIDAVRRIEKELALPLNACRELERAAAARMSPWSGRGSSPAPAESAADELISLELARATKTFRGAITLCRAGFGEQAAMLNRSMFEGMAVAHWIHANPKDAAERFERGKRMDAHVAAKLVDELDWTDEVDPEALRDARLTGEELEAFEKEFGEHGEQLWIGPRSLPKLLRAIEDQWGEQGREQLWSYYKVVNRDSNQLLHSSVFGLVRAFSGHEEGGGRVWIGPSNVHIDESLFAAFWVYSQILSLASDRFEFRDPEALSDLVNELQYCFMDPSSEVVKETGRNDDCPCGSGKKYKRCHKDQVEARRRTG